jgi:hypothetical protein
MGFNSTSKHLTTTAPTGTSPVGTSPGPYQYIVLQDQKASGTNGGAGGAASFNKRTLNTVLLDQTGEVSLSNSQFTIPAGTYRVYAIAPAYRVTVHILRLWNDTLGRVELSGDSEFTGTVAGDVAFAEMTGVFSINSSQTLEIQNRVGANSGDNNLGFAMIQNSTAVYTTVILTKIL